ncbi:MAG: AAA family ATPase [Candidatus Nomurabacteria bacterium]|nr:AAA family ATPase [Candidatus Nomurabacteria bacterium]
METDNNIKKLGLEGGPCSGKTTGLYVASEKLVKLGFLPVIVPEAATMLLKNGITYKNLGSVEFQRAIVKMQLQNEEFYKEYAIKSAQKLNLKPILLNDRALLTGAAYLTENSDTQHFQKEILNDFNLSIEDARVRYDGIIHMVTAANGAEEFYTLENNEARSETPQEARDLDLRTQNVWVGHPHLRVIPNIDKNGNRITFEQKIDKVLAEILCILGYPVPIEIEERYLIKSFDPKHLIDLGIRCEATDIEQTYLLSGNESTVERVRKRTYYESSSYFHTTKIDYPEKGGRIEKDFGTLKSEFLSSLTRRDPTRHTIYKKRHCFLWKYQYFEVDVFAKRNDGTIIMEREKTDLNESTELPNFIDVIEDITNNPKYSNSNLALN